MELENTEFAAMRTAAQAWREHDKNRMDYSVGSGSVPSLHDRIDDLINEIERLRNAQATDAK